MANTDHLKLVTQQPLCPRGGGGLVVMVPCGSLCGRGSTVRQGARELRARLVFHNRLLG